MFASIRHLTVLLASVAGGCIHGGATHELPSEAERAEYGRIALVEQCGDGVYAARVTGDEGMDPFSARVLIGVTASLRCDNSDAAIVVLPLAIIIAAIWAGATNPDPPTQAEVRRIRDDLETGFRAANAIDRLTRRFLNAARIECGADIYWEPDPPLRADGRIDYQALAERRIDTVVELQFEEVRASVRSLTTRFGFEIDARVRVVRTSDGEVIRIRSLTYRDPTRKIDAREWADKGGEAVTDELDRAVSLLAQRLAEDLFVHYRIGA